MLKKAALFLSLLLVVGMIAFPATAQETIPEDSVGPVELKDRAEGGAVGRWQTIPGSLALDTLKPWVQNGVKAGYQALQRVTALETEVDNHHCPDGQELAHYDADGGEGWKVEDDSPAIGTLYACLEAAPAPTAPAS